MKKIKILKSDDGDWVTLVVDGKIVAENHSLDVGQVLDALKIKYESLTQDRFDITFEEWVERNLDD
jgi:hypothetical protein